MYFSSTTIKTEEKKFFKESQNKSDNSTEAGETPNSSNAEENMERISQENTDMKEQVGELTEQVREVSETLQRTMAEYQNYRKRVERDKEVSANLAVHKMLEDFLPVLDTVENARKYEKILSDPEHPLNKIFDQLIQVLGDNGLVSINEPNVPFDANIHEAVIAQPVEGKEPDTVAEVFRTGYLSRVGVVRAAQVMVAQ